MSSCVLHELESHPTYSSLQDQSPSPQHTEDKACQSMSQNPIHCTISLEDIEDSPLRLRESLYGLDELGASIQEQGMLQPPVITRTATGKYAVIDGHRRIAAARKTSLTEIDVMLKSDAIDGKQLELALICNTLRDELKPFELAEACKKLMDLNKCNQKELAKQLGKSEPTISEWLSILGIPENAREKLADSSMKSLIKLAKLPAEELAAEIAHQCAEIDNPEEDNTEAKSDEPDTTEKPNRNNSKPSEQNKEKQKLGRFSKFLDSSYKNKNDIAIEDRIVIKEIVEKCLNLLNCDNLIEQLPKLEKNQIVQVN